MTRAHCAVVPTLDVLVQKARRIVIMEAGHLDGSSQSPSPARPVGDGTMMLNIVGTETCFKHKV